MEYLFKISHILIFSKVSIPTMRTFLSFPKKPEPISMAVHPSQSIRVGLC